MRSRRCSSSSTRTTGSPRREPVVPRYLPQVTQKIGATLALAALLVTTACGGSSSRPSQDELSKALQKGGDSSILGNGGAKVSKKSADCIAKVLEQSRISNRALQAIVDGRKGYTPSSADRNAAVGVASKIVTCLPAGLK